jgi:signal transduction histidine kinase
MRAAAAWADAIFVIRFLRAFEVETQRQIAQLQAARLEEAERRESLRGELLRRVVTAQEAERQRIARELHDETGQALTATGMGLRGVAALLNQDKERATQNLKQLETLVTSSLTELQHLIADLRPSHLDDLGLPATLRWWADEIEGRTPLKVTVDVIGEEQSISPPVRLALFRVAQEALTNVIKHAQAETASVTLKFNAENVSIDVKDDGAGFDLNQVMSGKVPPSWGLLGMQERAALLGGEVNIESQPGQGTAVQINIPYLLKESEVSDDDSAADGG